MQITTEKAKEIYDNYDWNYIDNLTKFLFQVSQEKLAMKFEDFWEATESVLGRPVFKHEFGKPELLIEEFFKLRRKVSLKNVINKLND